MPITPIEMLTMPPKSQEASHYKQNETQKTFAEQINISDKFSKEVKEQSQQTVKSEKSENKEYRYDAKEKGNTSYSRKEQEKKKKGQSSENEKEIKLSDFDIRI